ncbi:DUF4917 family protein [Gracilimonas sp. Q87]|uniref:DUF4917 family protein n=1 Tax=Gracilimonas sp. Q87 TaxID=3384766 RepID=UPI0039842A76
MMRNEFVEYDSKRLKGTPILLGNGFSIGVNERFDYRTILSEISKKSSSKLEKYIQEIETENIEEILHGLNSEKGLNKVLGFDNKELIEIEYELKELFCNVILDYSVPLSHLDYKTGVRDELDMFGSIYTTNYDLSVYYLISLIGFEKYSDGFNKSYDGKLYFDRNHIVDGRKTLLYLHGCLHIYQSGEQVYKVKSRSKKDYLKKILQRKFKSKEFPHIISEGGSEYKLDKISQSPYLSFVLESLREDSSSDLFIYGYSLHEYDEHIIDVIKSNFETIHYTYYYENKNIEEEYKRLKNILPDTSIFIYSHKDVFNGLNRRLEY